MRRLSLFGAGALLCVAWMRAGTAPATALAHTGESTPIVVELFTSEGCSSCPPADALLASLESSQPVEGAEIVALGHHVDYWNQLGWRDRFSSGVLTERQRVYARALNVESIYTPQLVVDGRAELVGSDAAGARRAIQRALDAPHGRVRIDVEPSGRDALALAISTSEIPPGSRGDHDEVIVAVTEDRLKTDVRRGENHGRLLAHVAVVRSLTKAGEAKPGTGVARLSVARLPIAADWNRDNLKIVAFVQEERSRHILTAAARPVPSTER
jgi:hypothetical protein